jgi:GTP-binding protein
MNNKGDRVVLEFNIPSRGLIGLTNAILTSTEGEAVIAHRFKSYEPWKGEITNRRNSVLIALEPGITSAYALDKLKDRGVFFVDPNEEVYAGQVIGECNRQDDIVVNIAKTKKLTNMRASTADDKIILQPSVKFSLEESMEYIADDEYLEVTPKSIRMRKIILDEVKRKVSKKANSLQS